MLFSALLRSELSVDEIVVGLKHFSLSFNCIPQRALLPTRIDKFPNFLS
jgi:hypothetical protein